jgi:ankyrin repeat protein
MSVGKDMVADGNFIGEEEINISVGNILSGNGYFKCPDVMLKVHTFAFTGTIECEHCCQIITAEPFDETMFTRVGNGTFVITVDPMLDFQEPERKFPDVMQRVQDRMKPVRAEQLQNPLEPKVPVTQKHAASKPKQEKGITKEIVLPAATFNFTGSLNIQLAKAVQRGDMQEVQELLNAYEPSQWTLDTCMLLAGLSGHMALAQEFIALGANVNAQDRALGGGQSHLVTAVVGQHADFVDLLIQAGAHPNVKNRDWMPALTIAVVQEDVASVTALLRSPNIDVNAYDKQCNTALMHAADKRNTELIKLLLQAGANPNISNFDSLTPLHVAVVQQDVDVVAALLQSSTIRVNSSDKNWRTALMYAAYDGNVALVTLLLQAGAHLNGRDKDGVTVLDYAKASDNSEVYDLIKQKVSMSQQHASKPQQHTSSYQKNIEVEFMQSAIYAGAMGVAVLSALVLMPLMFRAIFDLLSDMGDLAS